MNEIREFWVAYFSNYTHRIFQIPPSKFEKFWGINYWSSQYIDNDTNQKRHSLKFQTIMFETIMFETHHTFPTLHIF